MGRRLTASLAGHSGISLVGWSAASLLNLCILGNVEVVSALKINCLYVAIDYAHQLPHVGGALFINGTCLTLNDRMWSRLQDLLRVPQWGILGHSHSLQSR